MPYKDPDLRRAKQREYQANWYANDKNHKQQNAAVHRCQRRSRVEVRKAVDALKRNPCTDCGRIYDVEAMDFDHRPGEVKTANVGSMVSSYGLARVLEEIAKCDLVCASCHRIRTKQRRLGWD